MPSIVKKLMMEEYRDMFGKGACFMVNMSGASALEENGVRLEARKAGVEIERLKNRVVRMALRDNGLEELAGMVEGQTVVFTGDDPVRTAKAAMDAQKNLKKCITIRGGWMDGRALTADEVETLANMPSIEELYVMVVRAVQGPLQKLVQVLNGLPRKLVRTLSMAADKQAESAGSGQGE